MRVRVITPPAAIVTPSAIAGSHSSSDAAVTAMIQAVTEDIDGPGGWLGRALGPQTLEIVAGCFSEIACRGVIRLPYPPLIKVESVKYLDAVGVEQTLDAGVYRVNETSLMLRPGESWPATGSYDDAVRVRFKAGYNGSAGATGGDMQTGPVPEKARQAIILSVQHLKSLGVESLYLRADEVEDIGRQEFTLSETAGKVVEASCDRLLSTLRIWTV
jgi:hypothetical protein